MSRLINYINERSVSTAAFWISPNGEITGSQISHIDIVIRNPEKFGFTLEKIQSIYDRFNEPIGHEGKAREEIIKQIVRKKFTRIRKYPNRFWTINVFHMNFLDKNYLTDWAKKMTTTGLFGMREKDLYFPVVITDLGRGHKELTMGELAQGKLLEGKIQEYFIVEKNIEEWEILNE